MTDGVTKNGVLRFLALYKACHESQECQRDFDTLIGELTHGDVRERTFFGSYSDNDGKYAILIEIKKEKEAENRYSFYYKSSRP